MNAVICQFDIAWEDREENFRKVRDLLGRVEIPAGSLVVLPEMFSTGFSMHVKKVADGRPSQVEQFLADLAQVHGAAVVGGRVTRVAAGEEDKEGEAMGRNELLVMAPEHRRLARYQKIRTFRYTKEFDHYERGREVVVFEWRGLKICPLICYDLRFPELFRCGAAKGAQLFVVIASWPAVRVNHWLALLRARAIENQAYVIGVNRCGQDPNWDYPGASVVFDPHGNVLAQAGEDEETLSVSLSAEAVEEWRREFPALLDLDIGSPDWS